MGKAADQTPQKIAFPAHRRVVQIDNQRPACLNHENRILVDIVEAHHPDTGRQLVPCSIPEHSNIETSIAEARCDFIVIMVREQKFPADRKQA